MPFGHSFPISTLVGTAAGGVAGELAAIATEQFLGKNKWYTPFAKAGVTAVTHTAVSGLVGYGINTILLDPTGAVGHTVVAPTLGMSHGLSKLVREGSAFQPFIDSLKAS